MWEDGFDLFEDQEDAEERFFNDMSKLAKKTKPAHRAEKGIVLSSNEQSIQRYKKRERRGF
jgi:hypothetical protein